MPGRIAREHSLVTGLARAGRGLGVAALILILGNNNLQTAVAQGDTRTLSFHHAHTGEDITVTFKRNGRYDEAALQRLNWFMRDWRRDEQVRMEPQLFDLLWLAYREVGGKEPIHLICGYRSPQTNAMLRARSNGVAQFSQHTDGQAIDFFIPGVPLEEIRNIGLRMQRGGVGFYPTSGSPFIHLDTGSIRHWPRMSHEQLAKVFPDGRTVHIPSDGQPLPGFALALADVERQGGAPSTISLSAARQAGVINDGNEAATAPKNLLASLFGFRSNDIREHEPATRAPVVTAARAPIQVAVERIVPMPLSRPAPVAVAALSNTDAFGASSPLRGSIETGPPPAAAQNGSPDPIVTASLAKTAISSDSTVMAYAAPEAAPPARKAAPMGIALPRMRPANLGQYAVRQKAAEPRETIEVSHADPPPEDMSGGGLDGPWLRATIITPSVRSYLTATRFGAVDLRPLREFMRKPSSSLMMSFSSEPEAGIPADRFSGGAVVFLDATSFGARTASLR